MIEFTEKWLKKMYNIIIEYINNLFIITMNKIWISLQKTFILKIERMRIKLLSFSKLIKKWMNMKFDNIFFHLS